MGLGDNLMASGFAKGAKARGKRIAFGDRHRVIWDHHSDLILRGNPNVVRPSDPRMFDWEWIPFHRGNRLYNVAGKDRWIWNYEFRPIPGEVFLTEEEKAFSWYTGTAGYIVIEPNVPAFKTVAANKRWNFARFEEVARQLKGAGFDVVQLLYRGADNRLSAARHIHTPDFRRALSVLSRASLVITHEGGMHHGAAAMGKPAVVLYGGFIPPQVTGYEGHINLTGGAEACGLWKTCKHCRDAMERISIDEVVASAMKLMDGYP